MEDEDKAQIISESISSESLSDIEMNILNSDSECLSLVNADVEIINQDAQNADLSTISDALETNNLNLFGKVYSKSENFVVVQSISENPLIKLDVHNIIYLRNGNAIGRIIDIFGPVCSPFYIVATKFPVELEVELFYLKDNLQALPDLNDTSFYSSEESGSSTE